MPTACELAGAPTPPDSDGLSFLPTLLGRAGDQQQHEYLYWEFSEEGGKQAVRQGPWKAVRLAALDPAHAEIELYNLDADLAEQHDVAAGHPEIVARLSVLMREAHVDSEDRQIRWAEDGEDGELGAAEPAVNEGLR